METKICTTIEQCERLIKLGLDKSTADMHYFFDGYNPTRLDVGYDKESSKFYRGTNNKYIPAWSLDALLNLIPNYTFIHMNGTYLCVFYSEPIKSLYPQHITHIHNTSIDAAFKMVVWLLENGYIKPIK